MKGSVLFQMCAKQLYRYCQWTHLLYLRSRPEGHEMVRLRFEGHAVQQGKFGHPNLKNVSVDVVYLIKEEELCRKVVELTLSNMNSMSSKPSSFPD